MHYRKIKKLLSLALITFALLLPFWEDSRVQVDILEIVIQALEILEE